MLDRILDYATEVDKYLWGPWTMVFIALVAVFLTIKSGFFQFRKPKFIFQHTFGRVFRRPKSQSRGRMTPFQATTTALASTVGMGNIAGVATGLSVGVCSVPNLIALLALNGAFFVLMKDFMSKRNEYACRIVDSTKDYVMAAK